MKALATPWEAIDDPALLERALASLQKLGELLDEERHAVARLDGATLREIGERKLPLMGELESLARTSADPAKTSRLTPKDLARREALRRELHVMARRVRARAVANTALLSDAERLMKRALGIRVGPALYDARARIRDTRSAPHLRVTG